MSECERERTHTAAADEDDAEGLQHASRAHHPGEPQEQDDPEDVLQAGQVHPHEGPHLGGLDTHTDTHTQTTTNAYKGRNKKYVSNTHVWLCVLHE